MLDSKSGEVNPKGAGHIADDEDELRIYIVMRKDVGDKMSKAKFGVQVAHAALTALFLGHKKDPQRIKQYMEVAQAKIVLQVPGLDELKEIHAKAMKVGYPSAIITDAGRTEFSEPTTTCMAFGPVWMKKEARKIIGSLPTYKD